jgi:imidazolonepropionase-like amidohydrolase
MSVGKIIKCGILIDGTGREVLRDVFVSIEKNKITKVESLEELEIPDEAEIIDASDMTVMPGLMDLHIHLTGRPDPSNPGDVSSSFQWSPTLKILGCVGSLQRYLEAGFTMVREMGIPESVDLRTAIDKGIIRGPRLFVAILDTENPVGGVEMRRWTRGLIQDKGVDFIKIAATGGHIHNGAEGPIDGARGARVGPTSIKGTVEEHQAVCEEAHDKGVRVAVHAHGLEGIKRSIAGGVDTIEHCTYMDEETARLMAEKGIHWIPTLAIHHELVKDKSQPRGWIEAVNKTDPHRDIAWSLAREHGVKIAMGTDTSMVFPEHGENALELELMVERGMPEMEAIQTATSSAAEALGVEEHLGTIEPGKLADLIIVKGNPLEDIGILRDKSNIRTVIKNGVLEVRRDENNNIQTHPLEWA